MELEAPFTVPDFPMRLPAFTDGSVNLTLLLRKFPAPLVMEAAQ
jgi:hypothetical protein